MKKLKDIYKLTKKIKQRGSLWDDPDWYETHKLLKKRNRIIHSLWIVKLFDKFFQLKKHEDIL